MGSSLLALLPMSTRALSGNVTHSILLWGESVTIKMTYTSACCLEAVLELDPDGEPASLVLPVLDQRRPESWPPHRR